MLPGICQEFRLWKCTNCLQGTLEDSCGDEDDLDYDDDDDDGTSFGHTRCLRDSSNILAHNAARAGTLVAAL